MHHNSLHLAAFSHLMRRNQSAEFSMSTIWDHDPETGEIVEEPKSNAGNILVSEIAHALKRNAGGYVRSCAGEGRNLGLQGAACIGHCYFSIKDEGAKIDAVVWRGSFGRLRSKLKEGSRSSSPER